MIDTNSVLSVDVLLCPKCGRAFDPRLEQIVMCPRCERRGSTYCCNLGGRMVICGDCELEEDKND